MKTGNLSPNPLRISLSLLLAVCLLLSYVSCSSAPKDPEPTAPTAAEAAKFSEFGNSFFNQARFPQAVDMYKLALDRYIRIDNQTGVISAYNSLAKTYLAMGRIDTAELMLQSSYKVLNAAGPFEDEDTELRSLAAETFNNYGEMEYARSKYTEAIEWFNQGIGMTTEESDPDTFAVLLHNRGAASNKLARSTEARRDISAALTINTRRDNLYEIASNNYMLAVLDVQAGDLENALVHAKSALESDRTTENSMGIAHDLFLLGRIEHERGNTAQAAGLLDRAYKIFVTLDFSSEAERVEAYRQSMKEN